MRDTARRPVVSSVISVGATFLLGISTLSACTLPGSGPDADDAMDQLARAITAELVERIVRGLHPPGTPLPPEPALCETFSVSRTVIREAMKVLQEKGLVQVRQGSGTVVIAQFSLISC